MKSRAAGAFISSAAGRASDRVAAYDLGRVCEEPGCTTVLSKYNPSRYCSVHDVAGVLKRHV